jgi:glycosyltransferase involved in cell wall biosynthesis
MSTSILHLIGQMERGGAERQLIYLARALQERGWQQAVVTFNPGDAWDGQITEMGIPLLGIPRSPNRLWRLWQLSLILQRERPALVHSWSHHTGVYARWLLTPPRLRRIVSFRNIPTVDNYTGKQMNRVRNASVYAKADYVVSNSHAALEVARAAGVRMRRSAVINNIVIAKCRANPGDAVAVPRIVAAGALTPLKAHDLLLRALGQLAASGQAFEFLLAGEGAERPRLERLAAELDITQNTRFLGAVENVPELLASAHLLVHPSFSEGLSNTILEAMAEGLPVIASSVGGTPEVISDGETGLLVPPGQPDVLASTIRRLLESPSLRARLGRAGFEIVRDRCSVANVAAHYEHVYESVVAG